MFDARKPSRSSYQGQCQLQMCPAQPCPPQTLNREASSNVQHYEW